MQTLQLFVQTQQERLALRVGEVHGHAVGMAQSAQAAEVFASVVGFDGRVAVASAYPEYVRILRIENDFTGAVFDFIAAEFLPSGPFIFSEP